MTRKRRFILIFCSVVCVLAVVRWATSCEEPKPAKTIGTAAVNHRLTEAKPMVSQKKQPLVSYKDAFNDLNDVQLEAAMQNGISHPISGREEAEKMVQKGGLVYVGVSPFYYMDDLTHSVPYLVPKAHKLLTRIGVNYVDSLSKRDIPLHIVIVTSVLRTEEDVTKLQQRNRNASTQSCHRYGTTFDISYNRYKELGIDPQGDKHDYVRQITMKRTLGEVLRDLREEGRCYVKHEVKQGCFHVTVR